MRLSRPSFSRCGRRPPSRRRSSGSARRSGWGCCRRAASCRPSASSRASCGISRSTLRQALTTLVQSGHLVSLRGRAGGTFVAEAPPLAEDWRPSRSAQEAWAVLDTGWRSRPGATILAAERAESPDLDRLDELVEKMAEAGGLRGVPPRRHPLPHRRRRGGPLAAAGDRDDRGPGGDERADRPDRPPRGGADPLERPARGAGQAAARAATRPAPSG